jgi:DNA processing protein
MGLEDWLRLALAPEVGPVLGHRLIEAFGDPAAVFRASAARLKTVPGLGPARIARLTDPGVAREAREELDRARDSGVRLIARDDPAFPFLLTRMEYPPLLLWTRGTLEPEDRLSLAMVGPRTPSGYARLMAQRLAGPLAAQGLTVISGLAHGIDAEAHRGALESGGRTLAVLGQGLGTAIYPQANAELAERIVAEGRGALIAICPLLAEPAPGLFPARNEIIAGLALASLIVEASPVSGALITARHAAAMGRTVMACPGDATRRAAQGSNRLLAEGAALIQNPEDVLAAMAGELRDAMRELGMGDRPAAPAADAIAEPELFDTSGAPAPAASRAARFADPVMAALARLLAAEPQPLDALIEQCAEHGHEMPAVLQRLLQMEIDGLIRQMPGRVYALKDA